MRNVQVFERLKQKSKHPKTEIYALYLAYRDPGVPWYAKAFVALVVGYAFSPIDLIPDFIPVLGYLDHLVLIPLGVAVALKMIPEKIMKIAKYGILGTPAVVIDYRVKSVGKIPDKNEKFGSNPFGSGRI